ncbi:MAG: alpha/beta hydrolase [Paracoccaceae bacterium]|nr:alpha/beta hydrolase [Paracoccaceae bacterium]
MIGLLVLALLIALPLAAERSRAPVSERRRPGVPGEMVPLRGGATHVVREGPEDGPVAVLVHGLTTPSYVWAGIAPLLARAGYRVIRYDLYGRGFSDRPLGRQDAAFFVDQLDGVLAHENVTPPFVLVGYSMGGAIAAAKAAADPGDIAALVLVAPIGLGHVAMPRLARVPVLGDWAMWVFGGTLLRRRMAGEPREASAIPDLPAREAAETRTRGYLRSVLSSIRRTVLRDFSAEHRAIAGAGLPVLAIWAGQDRSVPLASAGRLAEINPDAWQHQIDAAGHGLPHTRPGEVAAETLRFLSQRSGGDRG